MRGQLLTNLEERMDSEISILSSVRFLKKYPVKLWLDACVEVLYMYTRAERESIPLVDICSAIGKTILKLSGESQDSGTVCRAGAFVLYSFEVMGIVELYHSTEGKKEMYCIRLLEPDILAVLWGHLPKSSLVRLPPTEPVVRWTTHIHLNGMSLVRTQSKRVLNSLSMEKHPLLFGAINSVQKTGWIINEDVLKIQEVALSEKLDAFKDIWEAPLEAMVSKRRSAKCIVDIANKLLGNVFYNQYYFDFRGRLYPDTAYLQPQGGDQARGLLLRAEGKPLGERGLFWLMVSVASNWGGDCGRKDKRASDKIPLQDRHEWVLDNMETFMMYAENPLMCTGWMRAESPWQFLSACMELKKSNMDPEYMCGLEVFIDGSNNGLQHLTALTRDEVVAPHVNLCESEFPGDIYMEVAEALWRLIEEDIAEYSDEEKFLCDSLIGQMDELKKLSSSSSNSIRTEALQKLNRLKAENHDVLAICPPVFWSKFESPKERRKIVKRSVMTISYGATPYGMGNQVMTDSKTHGIQALNSLELRFGSYLGRRIFDTCESHLPRAMRLLSVFEEAGKRAESDEKYLSWHTPIVGFPVMQYYRKGTLKKVWVQYGPPEGPRLSTGYYRNTLQLNVMFNELPVRAKGKQAQGAAPNIVHSLDATHLILTINRCDFPITPIHDSFGALPCDMDALFRIVRETFVELYSSDPLKSILDQVSPGTDVDQGSLDVSEILNSEYAFV